MSLLQSKSRSKALHDLHLIKGVYTVVGVSVSPLCGLLKPVWRLTPKPRLLPLRNLTLCFVLMAPLGSPDAPYWACNCNCN